MCPEWERSVVSIYSNEEREKINYVAEYVCSFSPTLWQMEDSLGCVCVSCLIQTRTLTCPLSTQQITLITFVRMEHYYLQVARRPRKHKCAENHNDSVEACVEWTGGCVEVAGQWGGAEEENITSTEVRAIDYIFVCCLHLLGVISRPQPQDAWECVGWRAEEGWES